MIIRRIFGDSSKYLDDLNKIWFHPRVLYSGMPDTSYENAWNSGKDEILNLFDTVLEELQLFGIEDGENEAMEVHDVSREERGMSISDEAQKAVEMIDRQLEELSSIVEQASEDGDYKSAMQRIQNWKPRTLRLIGEIVHPDELAALKKMPRLIWSVTDRGEGTVFRTTERYCTFLSSLKNEIRRTPEAILISPLRADMPPPAVDSPQSTALDITLNISHSNIGMLNTGEIEDVGAISANVSELVESGHSNIAEALTNLTEAVASAEELPNDQRQEYLDQLEELSRQATLEPEKRSKSGVIKGIVSNLATGLGAAGGLGSSWSAWGPAISRFFGV